VSSFGDVSSQEDSTEADECILNFCTNEKIVYLLRCIISTLKVA
jgi:hypothetical protein